MGEFVREVYVRVVGCDHHKAVHLGAHVLICAVGVRGLQELAGPVAVAVEWYVRVAVLEFVRVAVSAAHVEANNHTVAVPRGRERSGRQGVDASGDIVIIDSGQLKQCLVARAGELEHGLEAVDLHLVGILKILVEGPTEGRRNRRGRRPDGGRDGDRAAYGAGEVGGTWASAGAGSSWCTGHMPWYS